MSDATTRSQVIGALMGALQRAWDSPEALRQLVLSGYVTFAHVEDRVDVEMMRTVMRVLFARSWSLAATQIGWESIHATLLDGMQRDLRRLAWYQRLDALSRGETVATEEAGR